MALKSRVLRPISVLWIAFSVIAVGLAFYLDVANLRSLLLGRRTPDIEIQFFTREKGDLILHPSGVSDVFPSKEDIEKQRVAFPLNLAVHNLERQALRGARIEVSYPKGLQLKPKGHPKIDPENRVLIYEHQLRPLEPVGSFTPLDTIDTIYVSADFLRFFDVKVAPDGIPGYLEGFSAVLQPEYEQSIELGIKFFAEGRPPKTGKITLTFQTVFDTFTDGQDIYYDATDVSQDIMAISRPFRSKSARVVHEWVRKNSNYQTINYRKVSHRGGMYQLIAVDRGPTRIIADIDKDGFIDYDLIGVPGTSVTTRMVPRQRLRTKNWRPPITEITTPNGHRYRMIGPSAGPLGPSAGP